jgi:hypothetical protein
METVYKGSLDRSEVDIVNDSFHRVCAMNLDDEGESLRGILSALYATAYAKGAIDQRDFEDNKRRDPVNYHNGV